MIPTAFDYQRASSIDDALAKLAAAGGGKLLAGGHSLVPLMKLRMSEPAVLIDIARIPGLAGIRESGGAIEIGAAHDAPRRRDVARCSRRYARWSAETAADIGDPQVRNRGTIGGSLAHADPAADYPAVMLALDADIQLRSARGARVVKAQRVLPGAVHRRPGARRDHRRRAVRAGQGGRLRQAAPARVALRHRRRRGGAGGAESGRSQSARVGVTGAGPHATRLTDGRGGAGREGAPRPRRPPGARQPALHAGRPELRHPRERGVPSRDGSGLRQSGRSRAALASSLTRFASDLADQAHEEAVLHHLRDAGDQPLTDSRDRSAGLDGRRCTSTIVADRLGEGRSSRSP